MLAYSLFERIFDLLAEIPTELYVVHLGAVFIL